MDEGASAHTWLRFQVTTEESLPAGLGLRVSNAPDPTRPDDPIVVFETYGPAALHQQLNDPMPVYTWGNQDCCLERTATTAALYGKFDALAAGDYLLFQDDRGQADVVRLIAAPEIVPPDPIKGDPTNFLTVVRWSPLTPLSADYCAAKTFAYGNLVLATHGESVLDEPLRQLTSEPRAALQADIGPA